jgi:uncharacterized protein YkwD
VIVAAAIAPGAADADASVYSLARTPNVRCANRALTPSTGDGAAIARATVCLINLQRVRRHIAPLRINRSLARIAHGQSADMVRGDYFGDNSISGRSPLQRILPVFGAARAASVELSTGQNIGWGTGAFATPAGMVQAWMESPPHRRVLLKRSFREAGVGVTASLPKMLRLGSNGATYVLELAAVAS